MIWKVTTGALGFLLGAAVFGPATIDKEAIDTTPALGASAAAQEAAIQEPVDGATEAAKRKAAQLERLQRKQEQARAERDAKAVSKLRDMQGGWQLVEFSSPILPDAGRQEVAYMVISGEFLTIEMHLGYFELGGALKRSFIQTGTYRLNFNTTGELTAMMLIGTLTSEEGYAIPQYPGEITVYAADLRRGVLTLSSQDSTRFTFERMATGALTELLYREVEWLPGAENRAARRAAQEVAPSRADEEKPTEPDPTPQPTLVPPPKQGPLSKQKNGE